MSRDDATGGSTGTDDVVPIALSTAAVVRSVEIVLVDIHTMQQCPRRRGRRDEKKEPKLGGDPRLNRRTKDA